MSSRKFRNAVLPASHKMGRYRIIKRMASGGFGVVYLAQRDDGEMVAMKEFLPSIFVCRKKGVTVKVEASDEARRFQQGLESFFREADTLAKIQNDKIVPIWDVFQANGTAYFTMPIEKGGTIQALARLGKFGTSEADVRSLFIEACKGVEVLHSKGLLHLDIKPSNLWVRPDRSVVVLDLGASRWEDEEIKNLNLARTPGFAAPEQHSTFNTESIPLSTRTDIYGICASMLSFLSGHPPISAPERRVFHPPVAWSMMGQVSPALLHVIDKGMSLRPALRYDSVAHLRAALENVPRLSTSSEIFKEISSPFQFPPKN